MSAPYRGGLLRKHLQKALAALRDLDPRKVDEIAGTLTATVMLNRPGTHLRRPGRLPTLPQDKLPQLAAYVWQRSDPKVALLLAQTLSKEFGDLFAKVLHGVTAQFPRLAGVTDLTDLMMWLRKNALRAVTASELQAMVYSRVGMAGEGAFIHHPRFLEMVGEAITSVTELAADTRQMAALNLTHLDPAPMLITRVRAPGRIGPVDARFLYVDALVMFQGRAADGSTRYLVKIKGQSKLLNVASLVGGIDTDGTVWIGQMLKDRLRSLRGGVWHIMDVRIPREAIIDDRRLTKLATAGSRDLDADEIAALRADDIDVVHMIHDVPHADFFAFAHLLMKLAGITVKP